MQKHGRYLPHETFVSYPNPDPNPHQRRSKLIPTLCMKGS
jgi:hypothetical protein